MSCIVCAKKKTIEQVEEESDRDQDMKLCKPHLRELYRLIVEVKE